MHSAHPDVVVTTRQLCVDLCSAVLCVHGTVGFGGLKLGGDISAIVHHKPV